MTDYERLKESVDKLEQVKNDAYDLIENFQNNSIEMKDAQTRAKGIENRILNVSLEIKQRISAIK